MMSAKEAKKKSEDNKDTLEDRAESFLKGIEPKIKEAIEKGATGTEKLTYPYTQVSKETLKLGKEKLEALGYKVEQTEHFAFQTFTLVIKWT